MRLDTLYQEIILDHYKQPRGKGLRDPFDVEVHHVNPTCGDEITLRVSIKGHDVDAVVDDVSYESQGCSISQASASVLFESVVGNTVAEALRKQEEFLLLMQSRGEGESDEETLGDAVAFAGVSEVPSAREVRPAGVDGVPGRRPRRPWLPTRRSTADVRDCHRPGARRRREEAMRDVVDPELGINVVDLGLVYGVHVDDANIATLDMTLTSARRARSPTSSRTRPARPSTASSATSGSTGSGCRPGARTRSPTTAGSSCAPSASTSDPPPSHPRHCRDGRFPWPVTTIAAVTRGVGGGGAPGTLDRAPAAAMESMGVPGAASGGRPESAAERAPEAARGTAPAPLPRRSSSSLVSTRSSSNSMVPPS